MIYVIKTQNNDVILFDSILSFSESYQGSVTSHPVEDGSKISDNYCYREPEDSDSRGCH